jgi:hypothetical protein
MIGIITSVTSHLSDCTTRAPISTTAILTPVTLLLGNLILLSNMSASLAGNDEKEYGYGHAQKTEKEDDESTRHVKLSIFICEGYCKVIRKDSQRKPGNP